MTEKTSGALTPDTEGIAEWTAGGPLRSGIKLAHEGRTSDPGTNAITLPYGERGKTLRLKNETDHAVRIYGYGELKPHSSLHLEYDGLTWVAVD